MRLRWAIHFVAVLFFAAAVRGETWHKFGIGKINRVVAVPDNNSHFIAASEKGVIARFDKDLSTVWRAPPVNTDDIFQSISVVLSDDEYFLVSLVKSRKSSVRVYNATSGVFLWDAPGCKYAQIAQTVLAVQSCPVEGVNTVYGKYHILENGTQSTDELKHNLTGKEWKKIKTEMGAGKQRSNGDIYWSPTAEIDGKPVPTEFDVLSHPGGRMSLRERGISSEFVSRNEGSAHSIGAVFLSSNNGHVITDPDDDNTIDENTDRDIEENDEVDVLVTISEFGSLFAYDLKKNSGEQLWLHDDSSMDTRRLTKNSCVLVPGHVYHAVVLCVNRDAKKKGFSEVSVFEGSSGNLLFKDSINRFRAVHSKILPNCCSNKDVCVQLIDAAGKFRYASTCKAKYNENNEQTFIWVDESSDKIEGRRNGKAAWRFQLPTNYQVERVTKSRPVHLAARKLRISPFRVTDDRKLLRKYVDPHKILLIASNPNSNGVMVSIVDGTMGNTLKIINHVNASAPYSSVAWDNWFVYSYWNTYLLQQELHVIDMYEQTEITSRGFVVDKVHKFVQDNLPESLLKVLAQVIPDLKKNTSNNNTEMDATCAADGTCSASSSSSSPQKKKAAPELLHTAFLLSHQVVEISHSETEGGITENSLLFALTNGQVVSLSRLFVDARRPSSGGYSSTESLMPYYPYISFHPSDVMSGAEYVTKDKFISGLKGISVAPVKNRESSCHVASFGVDLNYRRLAPAGSSFDTLPEDFGFKAVIGSVAALVVAAVYSTKSVEGKFLYESWFNE